MLATSIDKRNRFVIGLDVQQ